MLFLRELHRVNEYIASTVGIILNTVLLYVIIACKIPKMRQYNIILLQTCCLDFFLLFSHILAAPVSCFKKIK